MNYCKDCLHFDTRFARCKASVDYMDPVLGVAFTEFQAAKEMRYSEVFCGSEGNWFEGSFVGVVTGYVCPYCLCKSYIVTAQLNKGQNCRCNGCGAWYIVCTPGGGKE